jgi:hypothetical protein
VVQMVVTYQILISTKNNTPDPNKIEDPTESLANLTNNELPK